MTMWMMWNPYVDSYNFITSHCKDSLWHHITLALHYPSIKPTSCLPLYGPDLLSLSSIPEELEDNSVWSKNLNESFCSLWAFSSRESHSLIGFSTFHFQEQSSVMSLTPHQSNTVIVCYLVQYSPIGIFLSVKSRGPTKNMRQAREYYSQQGRQEKNGVLLPWQKYKVASCCRESTVTSFRYRWHYISDC